MDELTVLGIMRRLCPGLVAVVVAGAFYFAPTYSAAVTMRIAKERAEPVVSLLAETVESSFAESRQHRSEQRAR